MARKLTFIMVLFALALGVLVVPATATYADESPSTEYYNVQYDFSYEETVMPTNQIVRKYEKPETSIFSTNSTRNSVTKTKAILASLGMGEDFIDALSTEQLNEYANSKSIVATEAFIKTDAEGNSTYVTESEAQSGARGFVPPGASEDDLNDPGGNPNWIEIERPEGEPSTDTYIEMILVVSKISSTMYHYSLDIEWLDEPSYRSYDLIGIAMQYNTIENGSLSGWYSYDMDWFMADGNGLLPYRHDFIPGENGDFRYGTVTPWEGVGAVVSFPNDEVGLVSWYCYYNFKAHIEVETTIANETDIINFNVAGSYAHTTQELSIVPSVGLSLSGPSVGMAFDISQNQNMSYIMFDESFRYVPDGN